MKPIAEIKGLHIRAYKNILLAFAEVVEKWSGYENISKKLLKTIINLNEKCATVYDNLNDTEFNVLGLGDLWCNNIMFKKIIGGIVDDSILVICYTNILINIIKYTHLYIIFHFKFI